MSGIFNSDENEPIQGYNEKGIYGAIYKCAKEASNLLVEETFITNSFCEKAMKLEALLIQLGYCSYYFDQLDDNLGSHMQNVISKKLSSCVDNEIVDEISLWHGNTYRFMFSRITFAEHNYSAIFNSNGSFLPFGIAWIYENLLETINYEYDDETGNMDIGTRSSDIELVMNCLTRMTHVVEPMNFVLDAMVNDIGDIKRLKHMIMFSQFGQD